MLEKNIKKLARKESRKPPIPYTRKTKTKKEKLISISKKYSSNE